MPDPAARALALPEPVRLTGRELGGPDVPAPALRAALVLGQGEGAVVYRACPIVKKPNEGYRFYDHDLSAAPS